LPKSTKVVIAIPTAGLESYAPLLLAKDLGEFGKEGIDVQVTNVDEANARVLLQSGGVDVAPLSLSAGVFNQLAAGSDIRMVAGLVSFPTTSQAGIWARSSLFDSSGKPDVCKFKGRTIAVGGPSGLGGTGTLAVAKLLSACQLTAKDIRVSPLTGANAVTALQAGAIDAAVLYDPLYRTFQQSGVAKAAETFYTPGGAFDGLPAAGIFMGPRRHTDPAVTDAIIRAVARTDRTYLQGDYHHDPKVRAALTKTLGVPDAYFDATPSLLFDPNLAFKLTSVDALQRTWLDIGGLLTYTRLMTPTQIADYGPANHTLGA
jgi:NitT/TauT family transport system substrate-binding protein